MGSGIPDRRGVDRSGDMASVQRYQTQKRAYPTYQHTNVGRSNSAARMGGTVPDRRGVESKDGPSSASGRQGPPPSGADYGVTDFDLND